MKADIQRIFRTKGIYITLGILLLIVISTIYGEVEIMSTGVEERLITFSSELQVPLHMMENTIIISIFMLPIITFIASIDFSVGTVKNILASGVSRFSYYTSKLILAYLFAIFIYSFYIIISLAGIILKENLTHIVNLEFYIFIAKPFLSQLFLILATTSVGMLLVFTTKKSAIVNGAYLAFLLVPSILFTMLSQINEKFYDLFQYELVMNLRTITYFPEIPKEDIIRILLIGSGYLVISIVGTLFLFRKSEVK